MRQVSGNRRAWLFFCAAATALGLASAAWACTGHLTGIAGTLSVTATSTNAGASAVASGAFPEQKAKKIDLNYLTQAQFNQNHPINVDKADTMPCMTPYSGYLASNVSDSIGRYQMRFVIPNVPALSNIYFCAIAPSGWTSNPVPFIVT